MHDTRLANELTLALAPADFDRLSRFIYQECGIKMPEAKKSMLEARLQKRVRALGLTTFRQYCDFLFSSQGMAQELIQMIDLVTTNKTDFFREPDHFDYLVRRLLPDWLTRNGGRRLAVWSAGCSTGEEPYTLAMVLNEYAERTPGFQFSILATDISTRVLEKAQQGIYEEERVEPIPMSLKRKYLLRSRDRSSERVRVSPELRQKVSFRRLNFMDDDFGLGEPLDVIFCRNVIIYFDRPTQERLLSHFCQHLRADGHLFLGHSETLSGLHLPLASVHPTVYRKQP